MDAVRRTALAVFGILIFMTISGCLGSDPDAKYTSGYIVVDFKTNVTMEEANQTILSHNLTIDRTSHNGYYDEYTYWVKVPEGEEKYFCDLFNNEDNIEHAQKLQIK
jgi:hypothetical protein